MKNFALLIVLLLGFFALAIPTSDSNVDIIPESVVITEAANACIDINTASFVDLQKIPQIGVDEAIAILRFRRIVDFRFTDDLSYIRGISATELKDIQTEGIACVIN